MPRRESPGPLVWTLPEPPRSARPGLNRDRILQAAMKVADNEGLEKATMRRIATDLGSSTPMSLYRYVGSKDGLADLMIDAVYAEVDTPDTPSGDWRADLELLGSRTMKAALRHPWWGELVHTRPPFGPEALRCTEFGLAALDELGLEPTTMMAYLSMVNGYVIGAALQAKEEKKMRDRTGLRTDADLKKAARPLHDRITADGRYPTMSRWLQDGARMPTNDGDTDIGLEIVLDGIAARIDNAPHGVRRKTGRDRRR